MAIPIFLFHRISPVEISWCPGMHPVFFEKVIKYLTKRFQIVSTEHDFEQEKSKMPGSKPFACITFDDGFKDNIEYAAPILRKYNCPASFYVVTDSIDNNTPTWIHLYNQAFDETGLSRLEIKSDYIIEKSLDISLPSREARIDFGKTFFERIKKIPHQEHQLILQQIQKSFQDVKPLNNLMLTWSDINELKSAGFGIGSHTKTHPYLSFQESDSFILDEFSESASRIHAMTGSRPQTIAYPAGDFDDRIKQLARQAGYQFGLAVTQKRYNLGQHDVMQIPRVDLYADAGWPKTVLRIHGILQEIKNLIPGR